MCRRRWGRCKKYAPEEQALLIQSEFSLNSLRSSKDKKKQTNPRRKTSRQTGGVIFTNSQVQQQIPSSVFAVRFPGSCWSGLHGHEAAEFRHGCCETCVDMCKVKVEKEKGAFLTVCRATACREERGGWDRSPRFDSLSPPWGQLQRSNKTNCHRQANAQVTAPCWSTREEFNYLFVLNV